MIILWDSATKVAKLSIIDDTSRYDYEWEADRNLARDMLAYLRDTLIRHDFHISDITGIGVFRGPGSFTGLRIGLTVLNTIASEQHCAIVGEIGDSWQDKALHRLKIGDDDRIVLPEYGAQAHITLPRK